MSFLAIFALAIAGLVVAPYLAHRLRRQRAEEHPFAAVRLVSPTPPKARKRAELEDRALFGLRALSVLALALLGASPLVHCSQLALSRGGASVAIAIVIDDSMSMRVTDAKGKTRFAKAKDGAADVLKSLRDGDAAAIVVAGAPARVALAATTDIGAARTVLDGLTESDRATDLDGALAIAKTLVGELPQIDRRVLLLSDLADGKPDATPLGEGATLPIWVAMPELRAPAEDCGILAADRTGYRARVRFACSSAGAAANRKVEVRDGDKVIASAPLPETQIGEATFDVVAQDDSKELWTQLSGHDAIASDDRAPLVVESGPAALAVIGDRDEETAATGGAPIVEQALGALHVDMAVRPLPQPPDRIEDTVPFAAIVVDDPPGFTPEQRRALSGFVDRGGLVMIALGRRAASAPLGATFEPFLGHGVSWSDTTSTGASVESGTAFFGEAASSLTDLGSKHRARLTEEDIATFDPLAKWTDGAPLVARRVRRGETWITTLPFSIDVSDFALRPGFLALLDGFVSEAKQRSTPRRTDVGAPWAFSGARQVEVQGPNGPVAPTHDDGVLRAVPPVVGLYRLTVDGQKEVRVAAPLAREIDMRARNVAAAATSQNLGGGVATVDVSWIVALVLLGLVAAEMVVRALTRKEEAPKAQLG